MEVSLTRPKRSGVMRKGCIATRDSRWEDFKEECRVKGKSSECSVGTVREAFKKAVKEEAGRLGYEKEHGFSEANHCAGRWNGSSHFVVCLPTLPQYSSGRLFGGYPRRRSTAVGVQSLENGMNGEHPIGFW